MAITWLQSGVFGCWTPEPPLQPISWDSTPTQAVTTQTSEPRCSAPVVSGIRLEFLADAMLAPSVSDRTLQRPPLLLVLFDALWPVAQCPLETAAAVADVAISHVTLRSASLSGVFLIHSFYQSTTLCRQFSRVIDGPSAHLRHPKPKPHDETGCDEQICGTVG